MQVMTGHIMYVHVMYVYGGDREEAIRVQDRVCSTSAVTVS